MKLKFKSPDIAYPKDVARMKKALADQGFEATDDLINLAWRTWSEEARCAGWYSIEGLTDKWIVEKLMEVLEPDEA